jgi:folate-binding protein YgfZ
MSSQPALARLDSRALVRIAGPDWRGFLQGLITQDVETLAAGELRYGALLTPQGRLLNDLFLLGTADGALLDVQAAQREGLIARLSMYRLRAKVEIAPAEGGVFAAFIAPPLGELSAKPTEGAPFGPSGHFPQGRKSEWLNDPRLPELGWRGYALDASLSAPEDAYDAHRLALGVPDPARDCPDDKTYPIETNFDLLNGIDFKKGCFVGQETTSRMKRRGSIKSRMVPLAFEGPPPPFGSEVLAGELRAGEVRSGRPGRALALMRLDRAATAALTVERRPVRLDPPPWLQAAVGEAALAGQAG